jgi:hypothetical protein
MVEEFGMPHFLKTLIVDEMTSLRDPTLLLLWGAHFNILHFTSLYWSFYLLKSAMKCEPPHGTLNLNTKNVEWLGLENASK